MNFNIGKKAISLISAVIVGSMLLTACSEKDLAAKVNGEDITMEEYEKNLNMRKSFYKSQYGEEALNQDIGNGKTLESMIEKETIDGLVFEEILLEDAKKRDLSVSNDDIKKEIEEFKGQFGGEENYQAFLEENGLDEKYFEELIEKNLLMEAHKKDVTESFEITDEEVAEYYEQNKEQLLQVKASHILVETEEEANEISEAIKNGDEFENHVEKSIEDGAAERKGDLGYFGRGQMVPEFEEAVFSMEEGTVSDPVKTDYGYHIIKLEDKKESLEDVSEEIKNTLKEQKYGEYVNELRENAEIEILLEQEEAPEEAPQEEQTEQAPQEEAPQEEAPQTESEDEQ